MAASAGVTLTPVFLWECGAGDYIAPKMLEASSAAPNFARSTGWITRLDHGVPIKVTVVQPRKSLAAAKCLRHVDNVLLALSCVDGACQPPGRRPKRPSSLSITLFTWPGRKMLPSEPGFPCDPDHCNAGVCVRKISDGSCNILVYRKEDMLKTLIHEMLHAYSVCDWCDADADIMNAMISLSAKTNAGVPISKLRPSESYVEALAVILYHRAFPASPLSASVASSACLSSRMISHYRGHRWLQNTHAFEYVVARAVLLHNSGILADAFSKGLQNPNRRAACRALQAPVKPGPRCRGRSLRLIRAQM